MASTNGNYILAKETISEIPSSIRSHTSIHNFANYYDPNKFLLTLVSKLLNCLPLFSKWLGNLFNKEYAQ